ncbi:hypothetical protein BD626DRAFT_539213 [Schizophyllum amplum]|uniref:Uncharacterized protein n=1 Tax=Schizophyllum amplum TaxID=97359 RepID=A0A550C4N2_9AGAR|nr:hypothetical protein BD626DRAFT_539213 [Auriculariopsis ampla]
MDVNLQGSSLRHVSQAFGQGQQPASANPQLSAEEENEWRIRSMCVLVFCNSQKYHCYTVTRNSMLKVEGQLTDFRRLFGDNLNEKRQAQYDKLEQRTIQLREKYNSSCARVGEPRLGFALSSPAEKTYEELRAYTLKLERQ